MRSQFLLALLFLAAFSGCTGLREVTKPITQALLAAVSDCTSVGQFNTGLSCTQLTLANCTASVQAIPGGSTRTCYAPPTGYEKCIWMQTDWLYTQWSWCSNSIGDYNGSRSAATCSDTTGICACTSTQILSTTCSPLISGDCASYQPNPLTASPSPASCNPLVSTGTTTGGSTTTGGTTTGGTTTGGTTTGGVSLCDYQCSSGSPACDAIGQASPCSATAQSCNSYPWNLGGCTSTPSGGSSTGGTTTGGSTTGGTTGGGTTTGTSMCSYSCSAGSPACTAIGQGGACSTSQAPCGSSPWSLGGCTETHL